MDFIKNNKLTCTLGLSCLVMGVLSITNENNGIKKDGAIVDIKDKVVVAENLAINDSKGIIKEKDIVTEGKNILIEDAKLQGEVKAVNQIKKDKVEVLEEKNDVKNVANFKAEQNEVRLAQKNEVDVNDLMKNESKKLLNKSNEELKARLQFNDREEEVGEDVAQVGNDLQQANMQPKNYIDYKVVSGDTLTKIFLKNGDTTVASLKAYDALKKVNKSYASLKLGEIIKIYKKNGKIDKIEKNLPLGKEITLTLNDDGSYKASVYEPKIIENDRVVTGKISSCFSIEAKRLGIPNDVIDQFVDLFSAKVAFRSSLKRGDVFSIKYTEKKTSDGLFLSAGNIKSASIVNQGKFLSLVGYKGASGKLNYYNEKGEASGNYMLRYPVTFSRISSVFSDNRLHPILKKARAHNGVDFAAPTGTPVRTVADGRVVFAGWNGGAGKMIKIQHSPKYQTAYMHLSKISPNIKVGKYVSRGEFIGNVGSTGLSTGPHLHYSFYINNKYVDPLKIDLPSMPIGGDNIPNTYLKNAIAELKANTQNMMASKEDIKPEA